MYRMTIFALAFALFLLMDPVGNIPLFLKTLHPFSPKRQRLILIREMLIALVIILAFQFGGEAMLQGLNIKKDALYISGAIILFLMALEMVFRSSSDDEKAKKTVEEPLIVPLAIPLIAGPAILAAVTIFATQEANDLKVSAAIVLSWLASVIILFFASFLQKILGKKGLLAMEKLMGLILTLMSVEMFLEGLRIFMNGSK